MLMYGTFFKLATFRPNTVINTMILTFKSSDIVININTTNNHCQKLAFILKERKDKVCTINFTWTLFTSNDQSALLDLTNFVVPRDD